MNAVALYGYIAITVRRWWITILCILVALWVILARLFAGDHFLGDIAGGLLGGLILLVLYMSAMPGVEKFVGTLSPAGPYPWNSCPLLSSAHPYNSRILLCCQLATTRGLGGSRTKSWGNNQSGCHKLAGHGIFLRKSSGV